MKLFGIEINVIGELIKLLPYYPRWVELTIITLVVAALVAVVVAAGLIIGYRPSALKAKKRVAHIEFKNEPPFIDQQVVGIGNRRWTVYFYSVQIVNDSDESIQVRHLKLIDLEMLEGDRFIPWNLAKKPFVVDWDRNTSKTIPAEDRALAPFARVYPVDLQLIEDKNLWTGPHDIPQLRFISFRDKGRMKMGTASKVHEGVYRFTMTCFFDNAPAATARFELKCPPEKGRTTAEALVKEIKIKMLKSEG